VRPHAVEASEDCRQARALFAIENTLRHDGPQIGVEL
jgi:hypothetical protein